MLAVTNSLITGSYELEEIFARFIGYDWHKGATETRNRINRDRECGSYNSEGRQTNRVRMRRIGGIQKVDNYSQ